MKKKAFSGVQPTGQLHLGNYLGAIKNWVDFQDQFENTFCVVDLHAITVRQDSQELHRAIRTTANVFMAAGIDPEKSVIFVQSQIPEHAELTWILNCFTYFGELRRMTQFKEKSGKDQESVSVGLFDYPVLMASDILLYDTDVVPVGEDQKQHVELTRDLAIRFNNLFGETFVVPEPLIMEAGARIMGLDDPTKKMSKTAESTSSYIALNDEPGLVRKKIMKAVTDSGTEVGYSLDKPALSNLLTIHSLLSGKSTDALVEEYRGKGYAEFKKDLAEVAVEALAPFQKRLFELEADLSYTERVLEEGAAKARPKAQETLAEVKQKVGLG
jgi:tryptophanyl-tRNA synthetase